MVKTILLFCMLVATTCTALAQKQVYDIVSFEAPASWKSEKSESFISYTKTDGDNWCQIAVYKHRTSKGSIEADFDSEWKEVVIGTRTVSEPEKTKPQSAEGWTIMAGTGMWKFNDANVASILTVYSNNKVCVSVLCNTTAQPYLKNLQDLLGSLTLDASKASEKSAPTSKNSSLVGLWIDYINEISGYANGYPQYTAGYNRREYLFNSDGTYVFRLKNWSVYQKDILFAYETGTYKVNGDQITIAAKQGNAGWWGKAKDGSTKGWGALTKASEYRLEAVTYTFELRYFEGQKESHFILKSPGTTQRDRGSSGATKLNEWSYMPRELDKSLIDNPPGFKVPKSSTGSTSKSDNSLVAGKTWEGTTTEKIVGGGNYNSGGFFSRQYKFNADGTYRFIGVDASNYVDTKSLAYETGTYTISGDKLTLLPTQGKKEEWTKVGKPSNGNSDVGNRKINESWGKKVRAGNWKAEKVTYTFRIEYMAGNKANALILQSDGKTEREGSGNTTYYFETSADKAVKLPDGVK